MLVLRGQSLRWRNYKKEIKLVIKTLKVIAYDVYEYYYE
jgi:hypothetical protein